MDIKSLWIGDMVRIVSKNTVGSFEGSAQNGLAIIKNMNGLTEVPADDLELWTEPEPELIIQVDGSELKAGIKTLKNTFKVFDGIIDLHYEKLAPERLSNPHPHILEFQLLKCQEFIDEGVKRQIAYLRIIHGKGEGKLKAAVEHLLSFYPNVHSFYATPDLGAVEVRMQYHYE
jgi:Smr domain